MAGLVGEAVPVSFVAGRRRSSDDAEEEGEVDKAP